MYLLDTNTLLYFFKGTGNVSDRLLRESPQEIGIPSIVLLEVEVGIVKSRSPKKRTEQLKELASVVSVIPFGSNEARSSAFIRARLESEGLSIGPYNVLIAGTAIAHNAILVTHNTREFSRIEGLSIQDWY